MKLYLALGLAALPLVGVAVACRSISQDAIPTLMGDDIRQIRRDALSQFPIGTPVEEVATGLTATGFACEAAQQPIENMTAEVVFCRSNGRSKGFSPAVFITVVARSGALTDFVVWNRPDLGQASALADLDAGLPGSSRR